MTDCSRARHCTNVMPHALFGDPLRAAMYLMMQWSARCELDSGHSRRIRGTYVTQWAGVGFVARHRLGGLLVAHGECSRYAAHRCQRSFGRGQARAKSAGNRQEEAKEEEKGRGHRRDYQKRERLDRCTKGEFSNKYRGGSGTGMQRGNRYQA